MYLLSLLGILSLHSIVASVSVQASFNDDTNIGLFPRRKYGADEPLRRRGRSPTVYGVYPSARRLFPNEIDQRFSPNFVVSPLGLFMSLTMTSYGAKNRTEELFEDMYITSSDSVGMQTLMDDLANYKDEDLRVSNGLFFSQKVEIKPEFINVAEKTFRSSVQKVDYENAKESNDILSGWCASQTNNRLKNSMDSGNVAGNEIVDIMNTVYYKGSWLHKFNVQDTKQRPFYVTGEPEKQLPSMAIEGFFRYGKLPKIHSTFVELPFKTKDNAHNMSMFIILPEKRDDFDELVGSTNDAYRLIPDIGSGNVEKVYIELPKFRIASKVDFRDSVEGIENLYQPPMNTLFNPLRANFHGLTEHPRMALLEIVQNSVIEVNEEGSEAASAMGCNENVDFSSATPTAPIGSTPTKNFTSFIVDHPFCASIVVPLPDLLEVSFGCFNG